MDIFCEWMVKRKKKKLDYVLEGILIVIALYLSFIAFAMMSVFKSFTLLVIAAIWYGVYYLINRKNIEYEYTLTNNILDIDRIFAKKSRKRITSIDIAKVDYIRPVEEKDLEKNPEIFDHFLCECKESMKNYVMVLARDGKMHRVFFTPNDKMKKGLKQMNPSKVTIEVDEDVE